MTLRIYNTLTRQVEKFQPMSDEKVKLYTCGPTVYNHLHVGNWAAYIYWDTLVRTLLVNGYTVERVMNITDVGHLVSDGDTGEDKLEKGAKREGKTAWEVAEFYSESFLSGMEQLGLLAPEHTVRATDFINEQLALVRILKDKGMTYQIDDGIYFDTARFPTYASFAQLDLTAQKAGARVEYNSQKHNASDFALWKFTAVGETRDMEWETPADLTDENVPRKGFPGWHLECSAMAMSVLGPTVDIHTGGIDHIPVHHTNEIAQSEAASGQRFSNYWLHNNHIKVNGTKISKSLNNGYTLMDLKQNGFSPMDYRMLVLQSQYSNEGNFTFENLAAAHNRLRHWRNVAALRHQLHATLDPDSDKLDSDKFVSVLAVSGLVVEALNNNLNTPQALRAVDEAFADVMAAPLDKIYSSGLGQLLQTIDETLGLQLQATTPDIDDDTKQLIVARQRARDAKDWTESDRLRDKIAEQGITVRDSSHGSIWEYTD
jgi:cysteinyl-tRNA synthetase